MVKKIDSNKEYLFDLPKIEDSRGNLSFIEQDKQIPFSIARVYWIYDVPGGQIRGSHAFKTQQEVIIALSGSFDVVLHDGSEERSYQLNRAYKALYIPSGMWRTLKNFATNSVCLVISSGVYDETEYIRNFRQFKQFAKLKNIAEIKSLNQVNIQNIKEAKQTLHTIYDCPVLELPTVRSRAGNLTSIHNSVEIPFDVKRIFFVYDIPYGKTRGMHAHRNCQQFLLSVSGSFDVDLEDGKTKRTVALNGPMQGLYVPSGIWTKETNYSSGAVCLVLSSEIYSEADYIRKYSDYKELYGRKNTEV